MYENYWGLNEKPFKNTPDPRYLYHSSEHEEALVKMKYTIDEDMGGAVLTGIFGCGKTVISQVICEQLRSDNYQVAYINNPQMDYVDLLRSIVRKLKPMNLPVNKNDLSTDALLEQLEIILIDNERDGRKTVVIIDEAHIIKDEQIFESLRLLMNFQKHNKFLLSLLLLGQPELQENIKNNKQFEQRLAIKCHLDAFDKNTTTEYIRHRLAVAGTGMLFNDESLQKIFTVSGGIPRKINRVCDLSLLVGFSKKIETIDSPAVEEAVQMMGY